MSASPTSVGIYTDTDTCFFHFTSPLRFYRSEDLEFDAFSEVDLFINSSNNFKFAAFHVPFQPGELAWVERLHKLYDAADHVFVFCSELHQHTYEQLIKLDLPKITIFLCGFINDYTFKHAQIKVWMDWIITTNYFYHASRPNLLAEKLQPHVNKSKYFDILLGCQRTHRDFIHQHIVDNQLQDKVIMTYHRYWFDDLRKTDHIFETDGLEFFPESEYNHTVRVVSYFGCRMNLSQIVPFIIYNDSYYSIVAETNAVNGFNFYTEKVVKPVLAKRLFVAFAGQHYLKHFRELGFKTFDSVIDESYDDEPDQQRRWSKAIAQVDYLMSQDPVEIYSKISDIIEHNQQLMLSKKWHYNNVVIPVSEKMLEFLPIAHTIPDWQDSWP